MKFIIIFLYFSSLLTICRAEEISSSSKKAESGIIKTPTRAEIVPPSQDCDKVDCDALVKKYDAEENESLPLQIISKRFFKPSQPNYYAYYDKFKGINFVINKYFLRNIIEISILNGYFPNAMIFEDFKNDKYNYRYKVINPTQQDVEPPSIKELYSGNLIPVFFYLSNNDLLVTIQKLAISAFFMYSKITLANQNNERYILYNSQNNAGASVSYHIITTNNLSMDHQQASDLYNFLLKSKVIYMQAASTGKFIDDIYSQNYTMTNSSPYFKAIKQTLELYLQNNTDH